MFRCEHCGELVEARQPSNKVVVERRQKTYQNTFLRGKKKGETFETKGYETVREINACPKCFTALTGKVPAIVQSISKTPKKKYEPKKKWNKNWNKRPKVQTVNQLQFVKE